VVLALLSRAPLLILLIRTLSAALLAGTSLTALLILLLVIRIRILGIAHDSRYPCPVRPRLPKQRRRALLFPQTGAFPEGH
jgi:hypothetical protein